MLPLTLLEPLFATLDGLSTGACLFDDDDRTQLWNRTFLLLFPEHLDAVWAGEPYAENLRRFYRQRLKADELPLIERYVADGVDRHRGQMQPFVFEHRGRTIRVSSLPLPGVGRVRLWRDETPLLRLSEPLPAQAMPRGEDLFDLIPDGVTLASPEGRVVWVNEPFVRQYRLSGRQASLGGSFVQLFRQAWAGHDGAETARFEQGLATLAEHLRFVGAPFELPLPQDRWVRVVEQQAARGFRCCVHVDITVLKRQQRELADAERRARESEAQLRHKTALLEATLEHMAQGVMMVNAQGRIDVCNPRAMELLDLPAALMQSRPAFTDVLAYQVQQGEFELSTQALQASVRRGCLLDKPHVYDRQRPNGRVIEVHSTPIAGGGVLRTITDISDRRRQEDHIRHRARHDGLTSLLNRDALLEQLTVLLGTSPAPNDQPAPVAVLYVDLDGFKPINDQHGHAVGDKVLALVGQRMRHAARDADIVARLGGDEFVILQTAVDAPSAATALAGRVLESLQRPFDVESLRLSVGASIGVALAGPADTPEALLRRADAAMYRAKAQGRNGVQLADTRA